MTEFIPFPKMPRLAREVIVSEKIDGTNGCIFIGDDREEFLAGSRSRWLTKETDNFGFHKWAMEHKEELMQLGPGRHFGEWWGQGIQRGYGLKEKRFSLFNAGRWIIAGGPIVTLGLKQEWVPGCCHVIPILWRGEFNTAAIEATLTILKSLGSQAAPGFMDPEGIVAWHVAGNFGLKKTIENDETPKGKNANN